ncbi:MAG: GHKL domain-containing protein [Thaumarchaeota archaeon]|nr:GHKL domain-containing protein [Nitrososphaerota archaeon]MBT5842290.1 GHKL domain-containing protein [Nitrososphaerota archaeon]MBT6468918.1 GHKL domain-containing protein [Nitrososphaerota archaeon]
MPLFLDMHELGGYTKEELIAGLEDDADEFGVTVHQMMFNEQENILHCICSGPNMESIEKHHARFNTKCDKLFPIDEIRTDKIIKDEKLKSIGNLSSRLAHDIRNPLTVLKTSTDLLKLRYPEILEKESLNFDAMNTAINRIEHQINDVLGFVSNKKSDFNLNDISEILNSSLTDIIIPSKITVNKSQNNVPLYCDFESIRIVFVNLILNAIQAMKNFGKIDIQITRDDDDVLISFENSGPIIPEGIISKIFDPLFTTKQEGTGLGLVSCKQIIDDHHGRIEVKNNPTTFTVILPQKQIQ